MSPLPVPPKIHNIMRNSGFMKHGHESVVLPTRRPLWVNNGRQTQCPPRSARQDLGAKGGGNLSFQRPWSDLPLPSNPGDAP